MRNESNVGGFFYAPIFTQSVMPWQPEYGTIQDPGQLKEVGDDVFVYAAPEFALGVNTVFKITTDGVIVTDAQILPLHAQRILEEIRKRTDKPVRYLTISHSHPDHTFGSFVFEDAGAELVSSYSTSRSIDVTASWYLFFMAAVYGQHAPQSYRVPRNVFLRSKELSLGTTTLQMFEYADGSSAGESQNLSLHWYPKEKVLYTADLLMNNTHFFFADGASIPDWKAQLVRLRGLVKEIKPRVIVPGHGEPGDVGLIDEWDRYMDGIGKIVMDYTSGGEKPVTNEMRGQLRATILTEYPKRKNVMMLDISLTLLQMVGPVAYLLGRPAQEGPQFPFLKD
jgi:glyoxylase-like metal-dependent hydrolase (beta-lactamase superfamily II)